MNVQEVLIFDRVPTIVEVPCNLDYAFFLLDLFFVHVYP